jgi:hypothetical protein
MMGADRRRQHGEVGGRLGQLLVRREEAGGHIDTRLGGKRRVEGRARGRRRGNFWCLGTLVRGESREKIVKKWQKGLWLVSWLGRVACLFAPSQSFSQACSESFVKASSPPPSPVRVVIKIRTPPTLESCGLSGARCCRLRMKELYP